MDKHKLILSRPFNLEDIRFKPEVFSKKGDKVLVSVHGTIRTYYDRLNWTRDKWEDEYEVYFTNDLVVVKCTVTLNGESHTSFGQEKLSDKTCVLNAQAQAFKRACVPHGPGRYLYNFSNIWADWDKEEKGFENKKVLYDKLKTDEYFLWNYAERHNLLDECAEALLNGHSYIDSGKILKTLVNGS